MSPTTPPLTRVRLVASEDGERPFDVARLADSIARALGEPADHVDAAGQLARVVVAAIAQRVVTPDVLGELVASVLAGAGAERAAQRYRDRRERRARARERLRLVRVLAPHATPSVEPVAPWSRRVVAAWLVREAHLSPEASAPIVDEVERGVLASELTCVSEALLREWVDDVLVARGERARLGMRARWVPDGCLLDEITRTSAGAAAERAVLDRALGSCARSERLSPALREAHETGALVVEALDRPTRWLRLCTRELPDARTLEAWRDLVVEQVVFAPRVPIDVAPLAHAWAVSGEARGAALVLQLDEHAHAAALDAWLTGLACAPRALLGAVVTLHLADDAAGAGGGRAHQRRAALLRREQVDDRLAVRLGTGARSVRRRIALDLPRLVLEHGVTEAALACAERHVRLAIASLADWSVSACHALDETIRREVGACVVSAVDELGLVGLGQALALARAARPADEAHAWLAALARRVRALVEDAANAQVPLVLSLASRAAADAAGRRDLRDFPRARDVMPVSRDRRRYRYDVGVCDDSDPGGMARHVVAFGLADGPAPRTAGSLDHRLAFLHALDAARAETPETTCD